MIIKRINILKPEVANKIAAGEVAERPAAVVKELVENSLDAGASAVTVEIKEGGADYIRVSDNGCGIPSEDAAKAFLRHATSKLTSAEGLDGIETLGFRGEALASIAAVSRVDMRTATEEEDCGTRILIDGGEVREIMPCGCPVGTSIEVRELFYNVPARLKFLKSPRAEAAAVGDYITRLILGCTNVSIKFINGGKPVYHSAGNGSLKQAVACVYGEDALEHLMPVSYDDGYLQITGYCGDDSLSRATRAQQSLFINGRYVRSPQIANAVQRAYATRLMIGRFPFFVLNIRLSPREVDVNVHPNKLSVKFRDEERICSAAAAAVREAIAKADSMKYAGSADTEAEPLPAPASGMDADREDAAHTPVTNEKLYELFRREDRNGGGGVKSAAVNSGRQAHGDYREAVYLRDSASSAPASPDTLAGDVMTFDFRRKDDIEEYRSEPIAFNINPYEVLGVAFDTYIIVEQGDAVFFIDQHAAHERILYERMIKNELRFHSQLLLTKTVISLTPTEFACLMQNIERFSELGCDIEEFGATSVSVQAVPFGVRTDSAEKLVRDIIAVIEKHGAVEELDLVRADIIKASCKHAIKAGQRLTDGEIAEILSYYAEEGSPKTCPHGRPIMICFKRREFEKMFKRIQ